MSCVFNKGEHVLVEIFRTGRDDSLIVHWCQNCGAIVVDRYIDGYLRGHAMPMRFPAIAYRSARTMEDSK